MKKLYFAAKWNKEDITKTWSGTSYSLFRTLSEKFDVIKIDIPDNTIVHILDRLSKFFQLVLFKRICDFYIRINVNKQIKDSNIPLFCIGAFKFNNPTYIFIDCIIASQLLIEKDIEEGWGYNQFGKITHYLRRKLIRRDYEIYCQAKKVFCMGKWVVDLANSVYPDIGSKFVEVGGGSNAIIKRRNKTQATIRNKILFVGRDFKRKGGDLVVSSFLIAQKERTDLKLFIAGPKSKPEYDNNPNIIFLGDVEYERAGELMNECDLFCMPSRFEAFGLVFIEALLSGLPCIARDAYEMKYFIDKGITGELIKTDNPSELAEKIISVLDNDTIYQNVCDRYSYYINKYNWFTTSRVIEDNII